MKRMFSLVLVFATLAILALPASAAYPQLSGAIFTTLVDGSAVNANVQYQAKEDVYLDGGPGLGAPQDAAGLPDGIYVFQVTDPSGKTLLSTDPAACRLLVVSAGIISGVTGSCPHKTGFDTDHGAVTVQLFPYKNTPNNGGEYKVWVTPSGQYECSLGVVDCGYSPQNFHGFVPAFSKVDTFKVRSTRLINEIDAQFFRDLDSDGRLDSGEPTYLPNLMVTWIDPNGASNNKYSDPAFIYGTFAHVENPGAGTHLIQVLNQAGCTVTGISGPINSVSGPGTVSVYVPDGAKGLDQMIYIGCAP